MDGYGWPPHGGCHGGNVFSYTSDWWRVVGNNYVYAFSCDFWWYPLVSVSLSLSPRGELGGGRAGGIGRRHREANGLNWEAEGRAASRRARIGRRGGANWEADGPNWEAASGGEGAELGGGGSSWEAPGPKWEAGRRVGRRGVRIGRPEAELGGRPTEPGGGVGRWRVELGGGGI